MKKIFVLILISCSVNVFSQDWPVKRLVTAKKQTSARFTVLPVFNFVASKILSQRGTYQELKLDPSFLDQLMHQKPEALQLSIPVSKSKNIVCDLVQFSLGNIKYTENNDGIIDNVKIPVTYRGTVSGEQAVNNVMLTVNEDYLSLVVSMEDKVLQFTKADETDKAMYRLYNSATLQFPIVPVECGNRDNPTRTTANGISINGERTPSPTAVQDKCINVFVDCFDSLFINQARSKQKTIDFVYELFNSVGTGYYNDSINIQITTINVWTSADPYRGDTRENALYDLGNQWKDNFWGNICVGLDFGTNGRSGLAGDIGRIKAVAANTCPAFKYGGADTLSACCYNDLNYTKNVQNFPVGPNITGSQVYLVMHEMGHLLGSSHTKWCGWKLTSNPDTFGAIDSCGAVEGSCAKGAPPGPGGGTIMSYCGNAPMFIGFNNGFGKLPGTAIRNFVNQSACVLNCSDCFGLLNLNKNKEANNIAATAPGQNNKTRGSRLPAHTKESSESKLPITSQKPEQ